MPIVSFLLLSASTFDCYLRFGQRKLKLANVVSCVCFGASLLSSGWPIWAPDTRRIAFLFLPWAISICGLMVDPTFLPEIIMYYKSGSFVDLKSLDDDTYVNKPLVRRLLIGFLVLRCLFIAQVLFSLAYILWLDAKMERLTTK
jgi:hypothetical protein